MNSWQIIALISFVIVLPVVAAVVMQAGPLWVGALLYVATIVTHVTAWVTGMEYKYPGIPLYGGRWPSRPCSRGH